MPDKFRKQKRFLKRFAIIVLSVLVAFFLLSIILFNYYKDDIGRAVLLQVNKIQKGELSFEDISFDPFIHFPNVSLELNDVKYFEKISVYRIVDSIPIVGLENLYLAFNIMDLVKGNVNVSKILLENGTINLIAYSDSTFNLMRAIGTEPDTTIKVDDTISKPSDFELNLDKIVLKKVHILYENMLEQTHSSYQINHLDASFNYWPDTIKISIDTDIKIEEARFTNNFTISDKSIKLNVSMSYSRLANDLQIKPSNLSFGMANFITEGYIDLNNKGFIDLKVQGDDKDFSILNLFLTNAGIDHIQRGKLYFNGTVKGMLLKGIPNFEFKFGIDELDIKIPNTDQLISELYMKGYFRSGNEEDLSAASLKIEQLSANLPGGNIDGTLSINNFIAPELDVDFFIKADVTGFDNIFDLGELDSLTGLLEIKSEIKGKYNNSTQYFEEKVNKSVFRFDSISFIIPELNEIQNVYGRLELNADTLLFKDLNLDYGASDFNINGSVTNVLYTLFDVEKNIHGNLHIKSDIYDFPDFFSWDQKVASSFPYRIKNINLFVNPKTTTVDLVEFYNVPRIVFDIDHLDAEIENFLPPVTIKSGVFTLSDKDSTLNLDFSGFYIEMEGGKLKADVVFNSPPVDPDELFVDTKVSDINPQKTFVHWIDDSIPEFLNGMLNGQMNLKLVISNDSIAFNALDFTAKNLDFINLKDTFSLSNFKISANDIDYTTKGAPNIMKTFVFTSKITADQFHTNLFEIEDIDYDFNASSGTFLIRPNKYRFFNGDSDAYFILKPFEDVPIYEIQYRVKQFELAQLLKTFREDTLMEGKMDMDLKLILEGNNWDEIKKNLDGTLILSGKNLIFNGLDLDVVIERFKRSQRFTLADVGAVVLMGPAGILVTKGSDFASLVVLNSGERSEVRQLTSLWTAKKGHINLDDVAFATNKNRMAAKGWIDLTKDSLDIQIALINKKGCSIFTQTLKGSLHDPESGKLKVMRSLFAPVSNLLTTIGGEECQVFYNGAVKPPEK